MPFVRPARFYRFNQVAAAPPPPPPPPPPPGTFSMSFGVVNAEGSGQSANFITQPFGIPFAETDISGDKYPVFELDEGGALSGTPVPYSWWNRVTYPAGHPASGMWRFSGFIFRVPTSVAASATLQIRVKSTAARPSDASISLADVSAEDFKVVVSGRKGVTGRWFSDVRQGIIDADDIVEFTATASSNGGGNVARVWKIGQDFMQGTVGASAHGGLYGWHYIFALQNAAGGLYGFRYLPAYAQPWVNSTDTYDAATYGAWKAFDSALAFNATTTIVSMPIVYDKFTLTNWVSAGWYGSQDVPVAADGAARLSNGALAVRVSSNGELPTNMSADATYGCVTQKNAVDSHCSGIAFTPWGPGWAINTVSSANGNSSGNLNSPSFGSGQVTIKTMPYIGKGDVAYFCKPNAMYNFVSGAAGTGRDAFTIPQLNRVHFRSTGVIPPFPISASSPVNASGSYYFGESFNVGHIYNSELQTGPAPHVGTVNQNHSDHWSTNTRTTFQNAVITGLKSGLRRSVTMDASSKSYPYIIAGSFPGMGFSWVSAGYTGAIIQSQTGDATRWAGIGNDVAPSALAYHTIFGGGSIISDGSHAATMAHYPYAITGRPEMLDALYAAATERMVMNFYWRSKSFSYKGRAYSGISQIMNGQIRDAAWAFRDGMSCALFAPDTSPYRKHWLEFVSANVEFEKNIIPEMPAFTLTEGRIPHYAVTSAAANGQPWGTVTWLTEFPYQYHSLVWIWAAKLFPSDAMTSVMSIVTKYPRSKFSEASGMVPAAGGQFQTYGYSSGTAASQPKVIASDHAGKGWLITAPNSEWKSGSDTIELSGINGTGSLGGFAYLIRGLTDGDKVNFVYEPALGYTASAPSPLNWNTIYYLRDVAGGTFKLAASEGGAAIAIDSSGSGTLRFTGMFEAGFRGSAADKISAIKFESMAHGAFAIGMSANVCGQTFMQEVSALVCAASNTLGTTGQQQRGIFLRFHYDKTW